MKTIFQVSKEVDDGNVATTANDCNMGLDSYKAGLVEDQKEQIYALLLDKSAFELEGDPKVEG